MSLGSSIRIFVSFVLALIWFIAIYSPATAFAETKTILVGDFVNETGDAKWDTVGSALAGSIAVKLGHVKSIKVINEEHRRRVMAEQRFGMSGFVDAETAAEVGKLAGATHIVYGTYTLVGDDLMAFSYLVNCATSVQEGSCQSSRNMNSTAALINEIAELMLGEIGATATTAEIVRIENEDIGRTMDTLALRGEISQILYEKGTMRRNIPRDELLYAKDLCEKILEVEPENLNVLNDIGNIWGGRLEDYDKAIRFFEKALSIDPDLAEAHNNLGVVLTDKGDLDGAIREYREAIRIDPDHAGAHSNLGVALKDKGDLEGAIREYHEAIRIDPDYAYARYNIGTALFAKGDIDGAIREYREAIRIDPDYVSAHNNLGFALYYKGDLDGAIREYREAIRIDPDDAVAYYGLGNALGNKGDIDGAIVELRKAVNIKQDYALAWLALALNYCKKYDDVQARFCCNEAMKYSDPGSEEYDLALDILALM